MTKLKSWSEILMGLFPLNVNDIDIEKPQGSGMFLGIFIRFTRKIARYTGLRHMAFNGRKAEKRPVD